MRAWRWLAGVGMLVAGSAAWAEDSAFAAGAAAWSKKDYPEAAAQWSKSALRGNLDALNNLAYLYFNGLGTEARPDDAIELWRLAAYAGHSEAAWHLGRLYERGASVPQDLIRAYAWYRCGLANARRRKASDPRGAEAQIEAGIKKSLRELVPKIGSAQMGLAEDVANEYVRRYAAGAP